MLCLVVVGIGIVFMCVDFDLVVEIFVIVSVIGDICLVFVLQKDGVCVLIVEYLMFVCVGFGIDNFYVDVDVEEIFIMDGSVVLFVFLL